MKMFTTAICFKSESSDYYMVTSSATSLEDLEKDLSNEWVVASGDWWYVEAMVCPFERSEVYKIIGKLIEEK